MRVTAFCGPLQYCISLMKIPVHDSSLVGHLQYCININIAGDGLIRQSLPSIGYLIKIKQDENCHCIKDINNSSQKD